ncbi:MAG: MazG-like family protein [Alicyclobacillaceae bacterium]|nr:MazG-like family protein [Alicyclobacillaceae bacterium]
MSGEVVLALPRLNRLRPTVDGTFKKLVEEQGELAGAVLRWREDPSDRRRDDVLAELLDVAQTCISLMFVFEDVYGYALDHLVGHYLENIRANGYRIEGGGPVFRRTEDGWRYLSLPALDIPNASPEGTVLNIAKLTGRFAQWTGKFRGESGESDVRPLDEVIRGAGLCLLQIAQCCFTMLYWLRDREGAAVDEAVARHLRKLRDKGYSA